MDLHIDLGQAPRNIGFRHKTEVRTPNPNVRFPPKEPCQQRILIALI